MTACPNKCRQFSKSDSYRVRDGDVKIGTGTLEAWSTCPVCEGTGEGAR